MAYSNPLAITTVSLGQHPSHRLDQKLRAAVENKFIGIEIVYADLEAYSRIDGKSILEAAASTKDFCAQNQLTVLSLNPLKNFEGHDSPLSERLQNARHWLEVAHALGALYIQIPSQFDTANAHGDEAVQVSDLQQLAELAASHGDGSVKIAYEAVAWGKDVALWQDSLRITAKVGRSNFGICLDGFHVLSRVWGDCTAESGRLTNGEETLRESLKDLEGCPLDKLFYVQFSDGEKFNPPLRDGHRLFDQSLDPRLIWSRNARPFPLETELGGYLPVVEFARAVLVDLGFKGWISFEIFDWRMREERIGPEVAAKRAIESWNNIVAAL